MGAKSGAGGSMNFFRDAGFNASRAQDMVSSMFDRTGDTFASMVVSPMEIYHDKEDEAGTRI